LEIIFYLTKFFEKIFFKVILSIWNNFSKTEDTSGSVFKDTIYCGNRYLSLKHRLLRNYIIDLFILFISGYFFWNRDLKIIHNKIFSIHKYFLQIVLWAKMKACQVFLLMNKPLAVEISKSGFTIRI